MIRKLIGLAFIAALIGLGVFWLITAPVTVPASALGAHTPDLANGRTVFYAGGCASCHAVPAQPDPLKLGGGLALTSPFGTFYAPNISPHPTDGIGRWSEADLVTAVLKGTSPQGTHYYPAFPYGSYHLARTEDVRDLFAFLKTVPPVAGPSRDHDLGFPFNIRRTVGVWKFLFLDARPFTADAAHDAVWNRGAYLVNGLGHCAECHSPRNALGGIVAGQRFAGGPNPEGEGWVPNITQKGLGEWSEKALAYFLQTGDTPEGDSVGGSMTRVIRNMAELSEADRMAIANYLKSLPAVDGPPRPKAAAKK